jgi:outer membrane protein|uniref:OmpW family protein n=1 Tax=Caulobacter sp. (strain K31) TaxID=366602 RepID=B0TA09_CAUSK
MRKNGAYMYARLAQYATALAVLSVFPQAALAQNSEGFKLWAVSLNATRVFVDEDAPDITLAGGPVPGSNVRIGDATSATIDIGYFFTPNVAGNLFLGVPATAQIDGAGSLEPLGTLAKVNYGPIILSAQYHFNNLGKVHPYLGVGVGRIVFLNERDRALLNFSIDDSWAPAAQVGVRYELGAEWMLNADVRYVPFSTHATGSLGGAPVRTRLDIDPILTSAGVTYRF